MTVASYTINASDSSGSFCSVGGTSGVGIKGSAGGGVWHHGGGEQAEDGGGGSERARAREGRRTTPRQAADADTLGRMAAGWGCAQREGSDLRARVT